MTPRKLSCLIHSFSYGGNGGTNGQCADIARWLIRTAPKAAADPRVASMNYADAADTPITMTRNAAIRSARDNGIDVLVMVDSDMCPDCELGVDKNAVPFWDAAFNFLYDHYDKGPVIIGAPYMGPPPQENGYIFHWTDGETANPSDCDFQLAQYTRYEMTMMTGIQPCAALPTGLIMCDTRIFAITEPKDDKEKPWTYYEWTDKYESAKASTEDVTLTRDISLMGVTKLGYNPVFAAWDSWAGHWKPKLVRKPRLVTPDMVASKINRAARERHPSDRKMLDTEFARKHLKEERV